MLWLVQTRSGGPTPASMMLDSNQCCICTIRLQISQQGYNVTGWCPLGVSKRVLVARPIPKASQLDLPQSSPAVNHARCLAAGMQADWGRGKSYLALRDVGSIGYKRVVGGVDQNTPAPTSAPQVLTQHMGSLEGVHARRQDVCIFRRLSELLIMPQRACNILQCTVLLLHCKWPSRTTNKHCCLVCHS